MSRRSDVLLQLKHSPGKVSRKYFLSRKSFIVFMLDFFLLSHLTYADSVKISEIKIAEWPATGHSAA